MCCYYIVKLYTSRMCGEQVVKLCEICTGFAHQAIHAEMLFLAQNLDFPKQSVYLYIEAKRGSSATICNNGQSPICETFP